MHAAGLPAAPCTPCGPLTITHPCRPVLEDMAEHPDGYDFSKEQAVLLACSTQVRLNGAVGAACAQSLMCPCDWHCKGA